MTMKPNQPTPSDYSSTIRLIELSEVCFCGGPIDLPQPYSSIELNKTELYTPDQVAEAILSVDGVVLLHPAEPSWANWLARWEVDGRWIEICIGAFEPDGVIGVVTELLWTDSELKMNCTLDDFLQFCRVIQTKCPAFWLHDTNTDMWTPEAFEKEARKFQASTPEPAWYSGWGLL